MKEEEQLLKKKIQEEENLKKIQICYNNNTPYSTLFNPENKYNLCDNEENNYYSNIYNNNSDPNNDGANNEKIFNIQNENNENYNNLIQNIQTTMTEKNDIKTFYVNQIPNEILIRIFNNPMFNQNDYYKFCLVCRSWNQAATIVLWNKPYICSFHQLVKFYKCVLYNDEILKLCHNDNKTKSITTTRYINRNLSKLVNTLDLTRVRLERPISNQQRTELYKALNILGAKLTPFLNSLSICREQCNSYLFLGTSVINTDINYCNQPCIAFSNNSNDKEMNSAEDLCFKEVSFPSVHNLRLSDLNYKSVTSLMKNIKKFNNIETLYISIALFQSWKEWNNNNHLNGYLIFQKVIENLASTSLKKVRLQNCCDLNDDACFQFFGKCHDIAELEILGSSNVSIDILYYSIKMLKNLKLLSYTAISTPQFKLTEDEGNVNENLKEENTKKGPMAINLTCQPSASNLQIIDINSSGWSPYLNWMFNHHCGQSLRKLILTIQTEEERDTIYKAIPSCPSLEDLILTHRHETNNENERDGLLTNEQLGIDLDKLFLVKTNEYQSNIKFLHISGLEIEKSKRLTKFIENLNKQNSNFEKESNEFGESSDDLDTPKHLQFNKLKYLHLYLPSSKCPIEYILYQFPDLEEFVLNLSEPVEEEVIEIEQQQIFNNDNDNEDDTSEVSNNDDDSSLDESESIEIINENDSHDSNSVETSNSLPIEKINFLNKITSKLKRVSIRSSSFGDGFTDKQITSIIEKCTSITNLELDCKSLTEDCLCHCIEILKGNLISLRLERVNRSTITDRFLVCLCQNNSSIQQLEIFAEHGKLDVTYEGTNEVIEKCKNLKYFSLGLEGFNPNIPYYLEQPSNYRSYFKNLSYTSKKRFI